MSRRVFGEKIEPNREKILALRHQGKSLRHIAGLLGVSAPTVGRFLKEEQAKNSLSEKKDMPQAAVGAQPSANGEIFEQEARDVQVEQALFRACVGYSAEVVKHHKVKRVEFDDITGKKTGECEEMVEVVDKVHVPPSIMAQRFYLSCRMPERWGSRAQNDQGLDEGGIIVIPEIVGEDYEADSESGQYGAGDSYGI